MTHNMVDALGICGVEGVFRNCCEVTMGILRSNKEALLNVLEAFLHDPSVEWSERQNKALHGTEKRFKLARDAHRVIQRKLNGVMLASTQTRLSVEGQVHELIRQATDESLLSMMYIGWSAHM